MIEAASHSVAKSSNREFLIKPCSPFEDGISTLIDQLDRYQSNLYPAESNHLDSRETLSADNCRFLAVYHDGEPIGIGSAKIMDGYGELKRFYVLENSRGRGAAECLIAELERWLFENGINNAHLETGIRQDAALRFYQNLGYKPCAPFGDYKPDPLSVFMHKKLTFEPLTSSAIFQPHYIVAFMSHLNPESNNYHNVANEMVELVKRQNGFLGMSSTRNEDGRGFTASFWGNRDDIIKWGQNSMHREAQRLGREEFYSQFKISMARVES